MAFDIWLAFSAASLALLVIPGPTVLLVLSYALSQGRSVAMATAAGVALGDFIAMTASLIGLGAIVMASATAFLILKWVGAAYLLYLGVKLFLSAKHAEPGTLVKVDTQTPRAIFWHSTTVTALNPKSIGFFIAFVPQFIDPSRVLAPQFAIMIATFVGLAAANAFLFALAADRLRSVITRPSVITWLTRAGGLTLIAMAALTATLRRAT
jgi:threonine/homoserine/homoserine lactone efflux protein